jgi:hypothetical protein
MIITLASATAIATAPDGTAACENVTAGSGRIDTAAMAVKCRLQIASVSSSAPNAFHFNVSWERPAASAIAPKTQPSTIDAATRVWSQMISPCTSKAAMPRKCIAAIPAPTTTPPSHAAAGAFDPVAIARPRPVTTIATTSDSTVSEML